MHSAGEAVGRQPFRHRVRLEEGAIDLLRFACEHAMQANRVWHLTAPPSRSVENRAQSISPNDNNIMQRAFGFRRPPVPHRSYPRQAADRSAMKPLLRLESDFAPSPSSPDALALRLQNGTAAPLAGFKL